MMGIIKISSETRQEMGKRIWLILVVCILPNFIFAQSISNYTFSSSTSSYTALSSATTIISANADETVSPVQSIGFDFYYNGNIYTGYIISSNGFISFTTSMTAADASVSNALNSINNKLIIAPLWDDLSTGTTGSIVTKLNTANSTQHVREIEFKAMRWNKSSADNVITFMIRLTQNTNTIEFWYLSGASTVNSGSASIGINGNASGTQQFVSINGSGTASIATETSTVSSKPSSGTIYKFTPAAPTAPSGVTSTVLNGNSIRFNWTDNASNETAYIIYYSTSSNVPIDNTSQRVLLSANTTTITLTGLLSNTGYFIKVFALKEGLAGPATGNGNTPYCAAVTAPSVTGGSAACGGTVTLSASGSSSGYLWFSGSSSYEPIATSSSYTTPYLPATTTYYVTAVNSSGCQSSPRTAVTATITSSPGNWLGSTSRDWNNAANWCGASVPSSTSNVTIISGTTYSPSIEGISAVCRNLTIASGANLTNSATLTLYGNISKNGTYSDNGTTIFAGASAQSITGAITFNHLTINNSNGITLNNTTTVNGILTLTSGTLISNGNLFINLNTGAIAGTGSGSISGNITVSKSANSNKYHYISSPLSGRTVADWNDDVTISQGPQYLNLYKYNETYTDTIKTAGWEAISSLSTPLEDMRGYGLYFKGATTIDETGTYTHSSSFSKTDLTNTVSSKNGSPSPGSDGWHLIGNPYPSALDWDAASGWTKTNLDNAIYFWDPVNSRYVCYVNGSGVNGGTRYIPSMQGFWIRSTLPGGSGSLSMTNSVRVTTNNPSLYRIGATGDHLIIKVSNGKYSDETIIRFMEGANTTFDSHADAYKRMNLENTPNLYTILGDHKYSINSLPDTSEKITVRLQLQAGFSGIYTMNAKETGSFEIKDEIILEDRLLNLYQDLRTNPSYTAEINHEDTSARFFLHFRKASVTSIGYSYNYLPLISIRGQENNVFLEFNNIKSPRATIILTDLLGHEILMLENADISSGEYNFSLPELKYGIYLVKVVTPEISKSGKILLTR